MHRQSTFRRIFNLIGNFIMILSFFFIIKKSASYGIDFSYIIESSTVCGMTVFVIIYIGLLYIVAYSWKLALTFVSRKNISFKEVSCIYLKSNLAKYIPGNIMQFINRNLFGISLNISQDQIAFSTFIEIIFLCLTSFLLSLIFAGRTLVSYIIKYVNLKLVIIIISIMTFIMCATGIAFFILKKKNLFENIQTLKSKRFLKLSVKLMILYSSFFLISGVILVFILRGLTPIDETKILLIISAYIVSWLLGYITPGAPGGLGIREAVLVFMLGGDFGMEVILTAAIIQRIVSIAGDVMAYISNVAVRCFSKIKKDRI